MEQEYKDVQRFFDKVRFTESCWEWSAGKYRRGYGHFWLNGKNVGAHRFAFAWGHGAPAASHVLHRCDNTSCVNPEHLYEGSDLDNAADRDSRGRAGRPNKKVTPDGAYEIRRLWANGGMTQQQIGDLFGILQGSVNNIVHGRQKVLK
jgi:hypothetical protein